MELFRQWYFKFIILLPLNEHHPTPDTVLSSMKVPHPVSKRPCKELLKNSQVDSQKVPTSNHNWKWGISLGTTDLPKNISGTWVKIGTTYLSKNWIPIRLNMWNNWLSIREEEVYDRSYFPSFPQDRNRKLRGFATSIASFCRSGQTSCNKRFSNGFIVTDMLRSRGTDDRRGWSWTWSSMHPLQYWQNPLVWSGQMPIIYEVGYSPTDIYIA